MGCPNHRTSLPTCAEAGIRYAGDYVYHQRVELGYSPVDIIMLEQADAKRLSDALKVDKATRPAPPKKPRQLSKRELPPIIHGKPYGYKRGCKTHEACPASPTCLTMARERWKERGTRWRASQKAAS